MTILTASIFVLMAVLALVSVDLLRALQARARAQTAADAAALAAAQEIALPRGQSPAEAAGDFAGLNGAELVSCRCEPFSGEAVVEVEVIASFVFLGPDRPVHALARAVVEGGAAPTQGPAP